MFSKQAKELELKLDLLDSIKVSKDIQKDLDVFLGNMVVNLTKMTDGMPKKVSGELRFKIAHMDSLMLVCNDKDKYEDVLKNILRVIDQKILDLMPRNRGRETANFTFNNRKEKV